MSIFSIAHFDVGLIPCARGGNKNLLGQAELGGLGIMDLNLFGYALRMRWLWFKKTDAARPWARLPDVTESVVIDMFNASVSVEIGNGQKALFWLDKWLQGKGIQDLAPCLFSSIGPRIRKGRTVAQGLANDAWVQDISGALTVQVILDFLMIWEATRNVHCTYSQIRLISSFGNGRLITVFLLLLHTGLSSLGKGKSMEPGV